MGELDESEMTGGGDALKWLCDKCAWKRRLEETHKSVVAEPRCCMCMLHGGALKQTDDNSWAHVVCVLCVNDESLGFKDPMTRRGVHVPAKLFKNETRAAHKCVYCRRFTSPSSGDVLDSSLPHKRDVSNSATTAATSITVKCDVEPCDKRFHVTCAYLYDACLFDLDDWPDCVFIMCDEHAKIAKLNNPKSRVIYKINYRKGIK